MNKLNGWQRAWVVTAVVWAGVIMFCANLALPDSAAHMKELKNEALNEALVDQLDQDQRDHGITLSREELLAEIKRRESKDSPDFYVTLPVETAKAIDAKYDGPIRRYPHDLALYVVNFCAAWAFPLIVIYLLGLGIAWVRVGFKQRR